MKNFMKKIASLMVGAFSVMHSSAMEINNLPENLIANILCFLPDSQSMIRSQLICKKWKKASEKVHCKIELAKKLREEDKEDRSTTILEPLANLGIAEAQCQYGWFLTNKALDLQMNNLDPNLDDVIGKEFEQSGLDFMKKAAHHGHLKAIYFFAHEGEEHYLKIAADQGHARYQCSYGEKLYKAKNFSKAKEYLQKAIIQGDLNAMATLGDLLADEGDIEGAKLYWAPTPEIKKRYAECKRTCKTVNALEENKNLSLSAVNEKRLRMYRRIAFLYGFNKAATICHNLLLFGHR